MQYFYLFLFAVSSAWACPDLNGSYTCYVDDYTIPLKVTSYKNEGVKTIFFGRVNPITDGKWYEYEDFVWPDRLLTQRKSECVGDEMLTSEENTGVYRDGVKVQQAYRKIEVSKKSKGDLLVRSVSSLDGKKEQKNEYGCSVNYFTF